MNTQVTWILLIATLATGCGQSSVDENKNVDDLLTISNVSIVDVASKKIIEAQNIVISDGQIVEITPHDRAISGESFDGTGLYALAGLYDAHVHIDTSARLELMLPELSGTPVSIDEIVDDITPFLMYGITEIVVLDGNADILAVRDRTSDPSIPAPRVISAGPILDGPGTGNPLHHPVMGIDEGVQAVDDADAAGYDLVKIYHIEDKAVRDAIIGRAAELGMPVVGHIPPSMSFEDALVPGFKNVAHAEEITRTWDEEDDNYFFHAVALMFQHEIAFTPNLVAYREIADQIHDIEGRLSSLDWDLTPPLARLYATPPNNGYVNDFGGPEIRERAEAYFRRIASSMDDLTRIASDNDVLMLAGSDSGNPTMLPGQGLYREISLMKNAGLDGYAALATATINVAHFLGEEDRRGTIDVGKRADIVLFSVDPANAALNGREDVVAVIKEGVLYDTQRLSAAKNRVSATYAAREQNYLASLESLVNK